MYKAVIILLMLFSSIYVCAQRQKMFSTYGIIEYANTLYDRTTGNNPWGIGVGVQTFLNNKTIFKPTIEVTEDVYFEDDDVNRLGPGNVSIESVENVLNVFVGSAYMPNDEFFVSFSAGPSFINGRTLRE